MAASRFSEADLTPADRALGVSIRQIQDLIPKVLLRGDLAVFPADTSPALASTTLRALGKDHYRFSHLKDGMPIYTA